MRYPLPYAFARGAQLLLEDDGQQLLLWHGTQPGTESLQALSEVLRKYPVHQFQALDAPSLAQRISAAYAQGESSAAMVVSEVESDADLSRMMQELPAVEDLLETADDAPIIRMLNALLTQAARDGASDIHIEPYERHSSVRFRVDGTLREVVQPNRALHAALEERVVDRLVLVEAPHAHADLRLRAVRAAREEAAVVRAHDHGRAGRGLAVDAVDRIGVDPRMAAQQRFFLGRLEGDGLHDEIEMGRARSRPWPVAARGG